MNMKKILFLMLGAALFLASCQKIDNWDAPNARLHGNVVDSYTGENLMMDQNDWQIRIIDRTWEQMNPEPLPSTKRLRLRKTVCIIIQSCSQELMTCFRTMVLSGLLIQ